MSLVLLFYGTLWAIVLVAAFGAMIWLIFLLVDRVLDAWDARRVRKWRTRR